MNDILSNPAFQEFLQKRCEEIENNDAEYQLLTRQSMDAYNDFVNAFAKYINISTKLQAYSEKLMLESGIHTAHKNAQKLINPLLNVTNNLKIVAKRNKTTKHKECYIGRLKIKIRNAIPVHS